MLWPGSVRRNVASGSRNRGPRAAGVRCCSSQARLCPGWMRKLHHAEILTVNATLGRRAHQHLAAAPRDRRARLHRQLQRAARSDALARAAARPTQTYPPPRCRPSAGSPDGSRGIPTSSPRKTPTGSRGPSRLSGTGVDPPARRRVRHDDEQPDRQKPAAWIEPVHPDDGIPHLGRFSDGLLADFDAVTAGLALPYSSGITEGAVNRIKALSGGTFGRDAFPLLRRRILLP